MEGSRLAASSARSSVQFYFDDARGHLVRIVGPDGGAIDRTFDADGRLVEVRGDSMPAVSFTYDAAGLRLSDRASLDAKADRQGGRQAPGSRAVG